MVRARLTLLSVAVVVGLVASSSTALAGFHFPKRYVRVASGRLAGQSWGLEMAGQGSSRCYQFENGGLAVCGAAEPPPFPWQRILGNSTESASLEFDITSVRVWRLNLLLGHGGHDGRPTWQSVRTRTITPGQARRAHLSRDFRFAVLTSRSSFLCVEKVRAFSRAGELLEKKSVPCEG